MMTPGQFVLVRDNGTRVEVFPASPLARMMARLIDIIVFSFCLGLVQIPFLFFDLPQSVVLIIVSMSLVTLGYLLMDGILIRRSIGKLLLNIRVVDARTLNPCTWKQSLFRGYMLFVGYAVFWEWVQLCGQRTYRFGDILAGTMVIRNTKEFKLSQRREP